MGHRRFDPDEITKVRAKPGELECASCHWCLGDWCSKTWTANNPNGCSRKPHDKACHNHNGPFTPNWAFPTTVGGRY